MSVCQDWITDADVEACAYVIPDGFDTAAILTQASELAYVLSGRQFPGECAFTARPCGYSGSWGLGTMQLWGTTGGLPSLPYQVNGSWFNGWCGCHWDSCGCNGYPRLDLGRGDIVDVTAVIVNGVALADSDWRVDSAQYVVRLDGGVWPCCQDMTVNSGAGYFAISYTAGLTPPEAGVRAAAAFATELIKACVGDDSCRLKPNVTQIARQGVSATFIDPALFLDRGQTGVYEFDLFVRAYNPNGLSRSARVWSPDGPRLVVS
jgi:hypothetical protein